MKQQTSKQATWCGTDVEGTMGIPYITSFFWCFSLEMGTKLVSGLHFTWSVLVVVLCSALAEEARGYVGTVEDEDQLYSKWFAILVTIAVLSVFHVLLAVTLIYGVRKRNTWAIRVWVWVMAALWVAALLFVTVSCALSGFRASGSEIFLYFLLGVLLFGFISYCILCVNSFYLMLKSSEDMEGPAKSNS